MSPSGRREHQAEDFDDYGPKQINHWVTAGKCVKRKHVRATRRSLAKGPVQEAKRLQKARRIAKHRNHKRGGNNNGEWVALSVCVCAALVVALWSI